MNVRELLVIGHETVATPTKGANIPSELDRTNNTRKDRRNAPKQP